MHGAPDFRGAKASPEVLTKFLDPRRPHTVKQDNQLIGYLLTAKMLLGLTN